MTEKEYHETKEKKRLCKRVPSCAWSYCPDEGFWTSQCGVAFEFNEEASNLSAHLYNYCHKCGGKISS